MQAYAEYGDAVKRVIHVATRMAAAHGIEQTAPPIPIGQGEEQLDAAVTSRTTRWESMLLLGDPTTIVSARKWHERVWELEYFARGHISDQEEWKLAWSECEQARHEFCRSARLGLGIPGDLPDVTWIPPWHARVLEKFGNRPFLDAAEDGTCQNSYSQELEEGEVVRRPPHTH